MPNDDFEQGFCEACKQICQQVDMDYTTCVNDIAAVLLSKRRERAADAAQIIAEAYQDYPSQMAVHLIAEIILRHWTKVRKD